MKFVDLTEADLDDQTEAQQSQIYTEFPYLVQTWPEFLDATTAPTGVKNTKLEKVHQQEIIKLLEQQDFEPIKIIVANKAGNSDVLACSPCGQLWLIEVKREQGRKTELQYKKLLAFWKKHAVCMTAYGVLDFKRKFTMLSGYDIC